MAGGWRSITGLLAQARLVAVASVADEAAQPVSAALAAAVDAALAPHREDRPRLDEWRAMVGVESAGRQEVRWQAGGVARFTEVEIELVRLSRMKTQTIMSQSQFASTVNAYCEERSNSSSAAVSAGVAGYSGSASRAEASYGKFCSRDTDDRGSESDYNEYMEGVQPGAYAAFAACEAARNNDGVQFEMSYAPARDRLVLGIYNRSTTGAMADIFVGGHARV